MLAANERLILERLRPEDVVLDIGGWARPFRRADWVMDWEPYATRGQAEGVGPAQGGPEERFSAATWIQRDICDREPFPFADKQLDFVICSHTLEDIRDPLWVCSEMSRIAKAGYVEFPSRLAESCRGIEPGQVGWSHHRWLIDVRDGDLDFMMKFHTIHSHWRYSFPARFLHGLSEERQTTWLFWEDELSAREVMPRGVAGIAEELAGFVRAVRPYPRAVVGADLGVRRLAARLPRAPRKLLSLFRPRTR